MVIYGLKSDKYEILDGLNNDLGSLNGKLSLKGKNNVNEYAPFFCAYTDILGEIRFRSTVVKNIPKESWTTIGNTPFILTYLWGSTFVSKLGVRFMMQISGNSVMIYPINDMISAGDYLFISKYIMIS